MKKIINLVFILILIGSFALANNETNQTNGTNQTNETCIDGTLYDECSLTQPFYCNSIGELIGCQFGCENGSCMPHTGSCWDFPVNATRCIYYDELHGGPAYWLQFCNGINHAWTNREECLNGCDFTNGICIEQVNDTTPPTITVNWTELNNGFQVNVYAYDVSGLLSIGGSFDGPGPSSGQSGGHSCQGSTTCHISFSLEEGTGDYNLSASAIDIYDNNGYLVESMYFSGTGNQTNGTFFLPPGLRNALNHVKNQNARRRIELNILRFQERYQERLQNMEGLEVTEIDEETGAMKLKAKEGVRFLGFIKGKATKRFEIDADGNIIEEHPWYRFMYKEDITEEEEEE